MPIERRQSPWWVPILSVALSVVGIGISGVCMILGPCLGAGMAVVGIYVTNQVHASVTDANQKQFAEKLDGVAKDVKEIKDQNTARIATDATAAATLAEHGHRLDKDDTHFDVLEEHDKGQERTLAEIKGAIGKGSKK